MQVPGTDDQCPDDWCPAVPPASSAHLCPAVRPLAPPTCAQQITHLCPAVHPPLQSSAPTCATLQCHLPVPRSATYLCPAVSPTCAHPPVPTSATHLCPPTSAAHQCHPPVQHPAVLPVSAQQ
ncbi:unnamed protein product [Staurois parvus]|uniref:Uncharacterized protein n=1 Tax=Staurois parvus TaxID=386267 RepID=A0ABN9C997_9NEOB|nr:unnamed protein product [Staurois parvus]